LTVKSISPENEKVLLYKAKGKKWNNFTTMKGDRLNVSANSLTS
jgi:hypothetical protein